MARWLFKSEPDCFSWDDLVNRGRTGEEWNGVRSAQARNLMREMKVGDQGLFYHSNIGKEAVGIVEVIAPAHPDSTAADPKWECVDLRAVRPLSRPVTLAEIKADPQFSDMVLVRNSRLSVQPVTDAEWDALITLSENPAEAGKAGSKSGGSGSATAAARAAMAKAGLAKSAKEKAGGAKKAASAKAGRAKTASGKAAGAAALRSAAAKPAGQKPRAGKG